SQNIVKVLSSGRTPFKTPAWSPDGRHLAYIANNHAESNLVVADADAGHPRSVVSLPVGENSFVWAPDSAHLAYSTAIMPRNPTYHGIELVDVASANSKWLTHNDVAAFFLRPTRGISPTSASPKRSRTTPGLSSTLRLAPKK